MLSRIQLIQASEDNTCWTLNLKISSCHFVLTYSNCFSLLTFRTVHLIQTPPSHFLASHSCTWLCSVIQLPHESLAFIHLCHRTACEIPPDVPSQRSTGPFLRMDLSLNVFFLSSTPVKMCHTSFLHKGTVRCVCLAITLNSPYQALPKWKLIPFSTKVYIVAVSSKRLRRHGYLIPQDFAFNPSRTVHRKIAREYKRQLDLTQHALPSELLVFINKVSCPYQHNLHHCKSHLLSHYCIVLFPG